jgi:hypothetical protein
MKRIAPVVFACLAVLPAIASASPRVEKTARKGDIASRYELREGALYRHIGKLRCQVTSDVAEFKIAQHPTDPTGAYLVKNGALHALLVPRPDQVTAGQCPKADLQELVPALARDKRGWVYKLVDRKDTPISLVAQSSEGRVTAWDAEGVAVHVDGVRELRLNTCFGSKKSFGTFVAFAIDGAGNVSKIGGKDPRKSKLDPQLYPNLDAFAATNRVCR